MPSSQDQLSHLLEPKWLVIVRYDVEEHKGRCLDDFIAHTLAHLLDAQVAFDAVEIVVDASSTLQITGDGFHRLLLQVNILAECLLTTRSKAFRISLACKMCSHGLESMLEIILGSKREVFKVI